MVDCARLREPCRDEKFKKFSKKDDLVQLGVFYDDDYDYQQHLKQSGQEGAERIVADSDAVAAVAKEKGLDLPADLFASPYEEDVGLLNRAAPVSGPRLDWDPEVVSVSSPQTQLVCALRFWD